MKREIKILIEDEGPLVEPGMVRVAVTEQDGSYRLNSLPQKYEYTPVSEEIGAQVIEFLQISGSGLV